LDGKIRLPVDGKIRFPVVDTGPDITLLNILGGGGPVPLPPIDTFCGGIGRLGKSCSTEVATDIFVPVPALELFVVLSFSFDFGIGTFGS
jgi:hypothetical protein